MCAGIEDLMSNTRSIIRGELGTIAQDDIDVTLWEPEVSDADAPNIDTADASIAGLDQGAIDLMFD